MIEAEGLTRWFDGPLTVNGYKVGEEDGEIPVHGLR
jgi:hypothetical protein